MKYSAPIKAILEHEQARTPGKTYEGRTAYLQEVARLHSAVAGLEGVALNRNPSDTDEAHAKKTHNAGMKLAAAVAATKSRATEILNSESARLSAELVARTGLRAPTTLEDISRHAELRSVLRGMTAKARVAALSDAVAAKDTDVLAAVFTASPLVTAIPHELMATMRLSYEQEVAPEILAELDALLEADSVLQTAARTADTAATDVQDADALDAFVQAEQAAVEAAAAFDSAL